MPSLFPFIVLIGAVIAERFISESALRRLSSDEKAKLLDGFSLLRKLNLVVLVLVVILAYLLAIEMLWAVAVYLTGLAVYTYRKLGGGSVNKCVNRHQAAFSWVTGLTGTPLTYWAPW